MKKENKENKEKRENNAKENITQYGEEIPTEFSWISIEEQKRKAQYLANISDQKNENDIDKKNV